MQNNITIKINIKGGILSPGDLQAIIEAAKAFGVKHIQFGERQNIYMVAHGRTKESWDVLLSSKTYDYEIDSNDYPNITSSYAAEDLFSGSSWLSEGIYQDVLNSITFRPDIKINIVDSEQGLVPLFSSDLNFIASSQLNYWFLFVKHHSSKGLFRWPVLIYSTEIGRLSQILSSAISQNNGEPISNLAAKIHSNHKFIVTDITSDLPVVKTRFPNYEGLNRIGDNYWLGIYRRDNSFSVDFLEALCNLCIETKIGRLCLTPWKSIIIKGIVESQKQEWEKLLGNHGINMRHSSLELNWQVLDFDKTALRLKKYLVKAFDKADIQTHGLGFTIKTSEIVPAGSIIIERKGRLNFGKLRLFPIYDVWYAEDFNPNSQEYHVASVDIGKRDLPYHILQLCKKYYEQLGRETKSITVQKEPEKKFEEEVFQCQDCLTVYQEKYGDIPNNISPGTPFRHLPETYVCPLCENPKAGFVSRQFKMVG